MMKKCNRLVVFGCSHTVGQYLPGWEDWPEYNDEGEYTLHQTLSDLNWPNVLANRLGVKHVVNCASGGNSNHEILCNVLNFDFEPDDLCIVCWSFAGREMLYQEDGSIARTMDMLHHNNDAKFYLVHSQFDLELKSREYMHHVKLYLDSIGIEYLMSKIETWKSTSNFWRHYPDTDLITFDILDYGFDNEHPGVESHGMFANKIYNKLIQDKSLQ